MKTHATYPLQIKRFILFDLKRPPKNLGEREEIHFGNGVNVPTRCC